MHRVDVLIDGQSLVHHRAAVHIMGSQDNGWLIYATQLSQSVLHSRYDSIDHPVEFTIIAADSLTQRDEQAHVRIIVHKGSNGFARIVGEQRVDRAIAILRLDAIMFGKRL